MEILICLKADFASVYLLNGVFTEAREPFAYGSGEPLYITALPLSAHLLPYTVKIAANKPLCNEKLCACFMHGEKLYIKLFPRYNYIYTPQKSEGAFGATAAERLFLAVKQKNYIAARKFLSEGLSNSIDDNGLDGFFNDYTAIIKNEFVKNIDTADGQYFLIGADGSGTLYRFDTMDGLIDNIVEANT